MNRRVFLQTYGCQMNERDSEEVLGILAAQGYEVARKAEEADVILLNTCSVRQKAEERAYGKMGELSVLKRERPDLILGIIGCMAKLHQGNVFKRLPHVDLVAGPAELYDLPYLLARIQEQRQRRDKQQATSDKGVAGSGFCGEKLEVGGWKLETGDVRSDSEFGTHSALRTRQSALGIRAPRSAPLAPVRTNGKVLAVGRAVRPLDARPAGDYRRRDVRAYVTIMEGCDKACTYCIVPKTRGQEVSRPAEEIIREIRSLAEAGYREVLLLGQNVNSYGKRFPDGSGYRGPLGRLRMLEEDPEGLLDFPALLRRIDGAVRELGLTSGGVAAHLRHAALPSPTPPPAGYPGSVAAPIRVRFTTSHPFDANERLFEAMAECLTVCEWLHLPVQSGSNRILRAMRRGYTADAYLRKIDQLRARIPGISLSTDIIVGFPGETDEDFEATIRLMQEARYDSAYIFKYSPRPGTDAAAREDDVPQDVKESRHLRLLVIQDELSLQAHRGYEGRETEILVEGPGRLAGQWFGRTRGNHGVVIEHPADLRGHVVTVNIDRALPHTLFGSYIARDGSLLKVEDGR